MVKPSTTFAGDFLSGASAADVTVSNVREREGVHRRQKWCWIKAWPFRCAWFLAILSTVFMPRRTLILVVALVAVLAGAGVWWWFNQDQVSDFLNPPTNSGSANTSTTVSNTNRPPVNASLATELKGDVEIDKTVKINDVEVHFSSLSKLDSFAGQPAGEKKVFLIVFFDPVQSGQVEAVQRGLQKDVTLHYSGGVSPLASLKIASTVVANDRGYLKFVLPSDASNMVLGIGAANEQYQLPL